MSTVKKSNRPVVSILMLFGFLTILITGLLSYGLRYNSLLSAIHTLFGLAFVSFGIFHLKTNLKPILSYLKAPRGKRWAWICLLLVVVTLGGLTAGLPPFQTVVDAGYALKELKPVDRQLTETLYTRFKHQGKNLSVDIKAGKHYSGPGATILGVTTTAIPQIAIWAEDKQGNYLETLYVTKKASNSSYIQSIFGGEDVRRPEALPHWSFARGIKGDDGLMMPTSAQPIADAITGATPVSSFDLRSVIESKHDEVVIKFEVNRSFDFNAVYHLDAYPNDPVYSGTGSSAQPSLIYATTVNLIDDQPYYFMKLLGRGHHSGKDGKIHTDLSGITTAKEMVSRIIVEVL
jgi:hypothetical protein